MSFFNKIILVAGGSSGIGAATAILFAKEAALVSIVGRNETKLATVSQKCAENGEKPLSIKADLTNDTEIKLMIEKVIGTYGRLDVLVNNAGITGSARILKGNIIEDYDKVMNINLRASVLLTTLAAPHLIETKGNIVNVSSVLGKSFFGKPNTMAYAISKAGLNHFTKGAALELFSSGVRVNTVSSGLNVNVEDDRFYGLHRRSEPEEMAELIAYLASDKAKSITGANYVCDNGVSVIF